MALIEIENVTPTFAFVLINIFKLGHGHVVAIRSDYITKFNQEWRESLPEIVDNKFDLCKTMLNWLYNVKCNSLNFL